MSFPEQLKQARAAMGYTQQQVADAMGITNSTYCGYETGKRSPDVAKIKQLAAILQTSGDVLLETGLSPDRNRSSSRGGDSARLAEKYARLSPEFQKIIAELTEELLNVQEMLEQNQAVPKKCHILSDKDTPLPGQTPENGRKNQEKPACTRQTGRHFTGT